MQFKPDINDGSLNAYDNLLQRNIKYNYHSDVDFSSDGTKVSAKKYTENIFGNPQEAYLDSPKGTVNLAPAYNLMTVIAK